MVVTDLTSLISNHLKKTFILAMLALLCASCASKKLVPLKHSIFKTPNLNMKPQGQSTTFINKAREYGLENQKALSLYAVDFNNDGYTDLVTIDEVLSIPKFFKFNPVTKKFEQIENPIEDLPRASFLNFADFDRDGVYDLVLGFHNQKTELTQYPSRVYKGILKDGKIFYKLQSELPTKLKATSAIIVFDFDLDGQLDLYLGNWYNFKGDVAVLESDNLLKGNGFNFTDVTYLLQNENRFDDETDSYPNWTPTSSVSVCDVDKNGFPDIMTATTNGFYNKLWLNQNGVNFQDLGDVTGYSADNYGRKEEKGGGNSLFSFCGDYNNDTLVDIFVGNSTKDGDTLDKDKSAILTGSTKQYPPKFIRSEFYFSDYTPNWAYSNRRAVWIDYNLDGLQDLLINNSGHPPFSRLLFFEQQADHEYVDRAKEFGLDLVNPSGVITMDLNHDGVMDFVVGQTKLRAGEVPTEIYVYENQTPREGKSSVRFHLQGKRANYHGISATLELNTYQHTYFNEANYAQGGYPSQNEEGVYFAFGKERAKSLKVRWPYSTKDKLGRARPEVIFYDLSKFNFTGKHLELNVCEDGRLLKRTENCF